MAEAIHTAVSQLTAVREMHSQTSQAAEAFDEKAAGLAESIALAQPRYWGVSDALYYFAAELEAAQTEARAAQSAVDDAVADRDAAHRAWTRHQGLAYSATDPGAQSVHEAAAQNYQVAYWDAETQVTSASTFLDAAISRRETAAQQAIAMIDDSQAGDGLTDTWWDDWGAGFTEVMGWIALTLIVIAAIALVVVLIIGTGGAAAVLLLGIVSVIGTIGTAITALNVVLKGIAAAGGQTSWASVGIEALGLIPFGKLASKSIFRSFEKAGAAGGGRVGATLAGDLATTSRRPISSATDDAMDAAQQAFLANNIDLKTGLVLAGVGNAIPEPTVAGIPVESFTAGNIPATAADGTTPLGQAREFDASATPPPLGPGGVQQPFSFTYEYQDGTVSYGGIPPVAAR
ncbi:hypothetical protein [Homoserinimonas sp. A520]